MKSCFHDTPPAMACFFAVVIGVFALFSPHSGYAQYYQSNMATMTFSGTSYDSAPNCEGATFASAFALGYPSLTNLFWPLSRSGEGDAGLYQSEEEKWFLPPWYMSTGPIYHIWDTDDNGGLASNTVVQWRTNFGAARFGIFYNGTAATNEGITSLSNLVFLSSGNPPHDSSDGDSGAISRNDGSLWLNANYFATASFDQWHEDWTNGWNADQPAARVLGFATGSHPHQGGFTAMAIVRLRQMGFDTNIASVAFDWNAVSATTNNCIVTSLSKSGNVLTFNLKYFRLPMGWVEQPGTITNQGSMAFRAMPVLARYMTFTFGGSNFKPAANYRISVNGVQVDRCTGAELNAGRNWFTNCAPDDPIWQQRQSVVFAYLDFYGVDHTNRNSTHPSGNGILGAPDIITYFNASQTFYDSQGLRGTNYVANVAPWVTNTMPYHQAVYSNAQPVTFAGRIEEITPIFAPVRIR